MMVGQTRHHTPYDGSAKPFTIGLKPLDPHEWIEVDHNLKTYLAEKWRLYAEKCNDVLAAMSGTEDAQSEVLQMLLDYLPHRFPDTYRLDGSVMDIADGAFRVHRMFNPVSALATAGRLVQEDLVIMGRSPEGWRLVAASLCFPSAWNLHEKIGRLMHEVHGPVPGFNKDTRNAGLIERMFDNLRVEQPVIRWNWTLFGEDTLHLPAAENSMTRRFGDGPVAEHVFMRLERQTLRKLPRTGDILFTIRTHIDPMDVLEHHADGPRLAAAMAGQVAAFSPEEMAYKGLAGEQQRLLARLAQLQGK
jgi:dimethylamine monooxygenase subunit A